MKKMFNVNASATGVDFSILIARAGIAILMLTHGIPKLAMLFSGDAIQFPGMFGMSPEISLALTVFAEVLCSFFILFGLGTRLAVIPLIGIMLVAALYIHIADPFARQEPALMYLLVYLVLLFSGSGRFSLDYMLQRPASAHTAELRGRNFRNQDKATALRRRADLMR